MRAKETVLKGQVIFFSVTYFLNIKNGIKKEQLINQLLFFCDPFVRSYKMQRTTKLFFLLLNLVYQDVSATLLYK